MRPPRVLTFLTLAGLVPVMAARAQQAATPVRPHSPVRGSVYDSLAGEPMGNARVWIEGTTLSAVADGRGRYAFDSVPAGARRFLFEHPALDSIGLPQLGRRVTITASDVPATVNLGVPSLATFFRSLCGSPPPDQPRDADPIGVVFGAVSDAGSGTRLAGARIEASWVRLTFERGTRGRILDLGRSALNVRSDSLGNYYVCGVPTRQMITVAGATEESATGRLDVLVGDRRITRQDLRIPVDTETMTADSAGKLVGTAFLAGTVTNEFGRPLEGALAGVDDASAAAGSDAAGRFLLRDLPAGTHMAMVRAVGYSAHRVAVDLRGGDTARIHAVLHQLTVLDTLTVSAPRNLVLAETVNRLRMGLGHSLMGPTVRRAAFMANVIRQLPSIDVRDNGRDVQVTTRIGGRQCPAHIWIDGWRGDPELLRSVKPADVVAVEWYPRGTQVPLRYSPPALDHCGVLLVWTDALR